MDAEELLEKWKKDSSQVNFAELKRLFFNQKIVAFLEYNKYEPRYWKYEEKKMDDIPHQNQISANLVAENG